VTGAPHRGCVGFAALFAVAFSPSFVHAGNDDELIVGNQAALVGGAVAAVVQDSSATWYNPAGLGAIDRDQVDVSATVYTLRSYSVPAFLSAPGGETHDASVTEFVTVPAQIAYVRRLGTGISLGFGYFVPHASNFVLREMLDAHAGTVVSQWQFAATFAETQHMGAVALGVSLSDRVRIGVSLLGGYAATTKSIFLFGASEPPGQVAASIASNVLGTTTRISLEAAFGLQVEVAEDLSLAVALRSPRVQVHAVSDLIRNQSTSSVADPDAPTLSAEASHDEESQGIGLLLAGRATVGIAYRYANGFVAGEVDAQPGLRQSELGVNRRAVINARAGVYHAIRPSMAVGLGLFTDRNAQATPIQIASGSGDFYGATAGVELSNKHALAAGEPTDSLVFSSVFALRYAFSVGDFGRVVVDPANIASAPFATESGRLFVQEFGFYVGSGLRF
jgi:hypothetical protein